MLGSDDEVQNQGNAQNIHHRMDGLCLAGANLDEHIGQDAQADAGSDVASMIKKAFEDAVAECRYQAG